MNNVILLYNLLNPGVGGEGTSFRLHLFLIHFQFLLIIIFQDKIQVILKSLLIFLKFKKKITEKYRNSNNTEH